MTRRVQMRYLLVCAVMVAASAIATAAKPRTKIADLGPAVNLEVMVPKTFGEWRVDETIVPILPSPETQLLLNKIYNQTLARTYVNRSGDRIMLSIAYGGDQSDSMQVHRPEVCYAAQGFQILDDVKGLLTTGFGEVPVKRLLARLGSRNEPITYWITVGDTATYVGIRQKIVQLSYGLTGRVPDGMLVRVSSIDRNSDAAYRLQESFVKQLASTLDSSARMRLLGGQS
jgi:EpsI family protein